MPHLAKGPRPDINNGPGVIRIVPTFWPQKLFKFNSSNGPSLGHSNLGSDGRYTCSCLPLIVWWVPYLNNGCSLTSIIAKEVTRIVPRFGPWRLFESNSNNGPPWAPPVLCQMNYTSVQVSYLRFPGGYHIRPSPPTPDLNSGPGNDSNIGCILALQRLFESNLNNSPSPSHSNLVSDGLYICPGLLLMVSWWVPYLPKSCRPDFNNGLGGDSNSGPVLAPWRLSESDSTDGPIPGPLQSCFR